MGRKIDMVGKKFGRLTVVEYAGNSRRGQCRWKCRCECGNTIETNGYDLRSGNTRSCGCLSTEKATVRVRKLVVDHSLPSSMLSTKLSKANTSGIRGVSPIKNKWRATIGVKGKLIWLGDYDNIRDAEIARKNAELEYWKPILEGR